MASGADYGTQGLRNLQASSLRLDTSRGKGPGEADMQVPHCIYSQGRGRIIQGPRCWKVEVLSSSILSPLLPHRLLPHKHHLLNLLASLSVSSLSLL